MHAARNVAMSFLLVLAVSACSKAPVTETASPASMPGVALTPTGPAGALPCQVAQLLEKHCVQCHGSVPQMGAPHSLLTPANFQKDVGGQSLGAIAVLRINNPTRRMPPAPNPALSEVEVSAFTAWVTGGALPQSMGCSVREPVAASGMAGTVATTGTTVSTAGSSAVGTVPANAGGAGGSTAVVGQPPTTSGAAGGNGPVKVDPAATGWPMFGGDLSNTRNNATTKLTATSVKSFHRVWQFAGPAVTSTPALVDGTVYFGGWDSKVYALRAADGMKLWATQVPHLVDSSPAVTADRVIVADNNGLVSALDRTSGAVIWSKPAETVGLPHLWSSPIVIPDANLIVVGVASAEESMMRGKAYTFRGSVSALDLATGAVRWQFYTTNLDAMSGPGVGVWSTAAVDPALKLLYIGTGNAYAAPAGPLTDSLLAIRYDTGMLEWSHQFTSNDVFSLYTGGGGPDSDVGSSPNLFSAGGKDLVGVGVKNGIYYALDRKTGTVVWQHQVSMGSELGGIMGAAAVANGVIFVAGNQGIMGAATVMALNATDGTMLWSFNAPRGVYAGLAHGGGVVYLSTTGGGLIGLDAATGQQLWMDMLPNGAAAGASIGDSLLFAPWGFYFTLLNGTEPGMGGLIAYGP